MNADERKNLIGGLIKNHLPALVLFARQWNHGAAEDVVQEAFLKLIKQNSMPNEPLPWLFTVIRNESNGLIRSHLRRKNRENESFAQKNGWFSPSEDEEKLIQELETLPQEFREIIVSKIWGKLTFEQIGTMLESSRSSVHRKYYEGLAILKEKLENHDEID